MPSASIMMDTYSLSLVARLKSMESNWEAFFSHIKMHLTVLDAKTDRLSAQF